MMARERNAPCACGSGKKNKACCNIVPLTPAPDQGRTAPAPLTMDQLKAQAYDCLANIEHFQRELARLNQAIAAKG